MSEAGLTGDPIFVEVSTDQQFSANEFAMIPEQQESKHETAAISVMNPQNNSMIAETLPVIQAGEVIGQRIRCPECQRFTADSEEKILRHIRSYHRGENAFQCSMCDYSTYNKSLFEEHVRIHQGIKPFKCSQCEYRSVSKKNTKKHEAIHRPDNPLRCTECGFVARHSKALQLHRSSHSVGAVSLINCPLDSSFECEKASELRAHSIVLHKNCPNCDFVACGQHSLTRHLAEVHKIVRNKIVKKEKKEKPPLFQCGLCEWSSSVKRKVLLHLIHHPDQEVDEDIIDVSVLRECGIMT